MPGLYVPPFGRRSLPKTSTEQISQISQHEYAEETVFWTLKSAEAFSARRRTTYLYLADPAAGEPTEYSWVDNTDRLWEGLSAVLQRNQPGSIAINAHPEIAFSSGMHAGELAAMASALDSRWIDRFVVKPMLGVEFIGTQMDARLGWYRKLQETAWATIQEAFSEKVIVPDATTTQDVQWWMREKLQAMNYTTWFQPSVSILNRVGENGPGDPAGDDTITYGDLLHVDFGVSAMGMNTDTQHLGYVLRPGQTEDDVPGDIYQGLRKGNRLQDIVRENMVPGMTGNAILEAARKQMHDEGIEGKIYSHPVGDWGHSAGTLLGKDWPRIPVYIYVVFQANTEGSLQVSPISRRMLAFLENCPC